MDNLVKLSRTHVLEVLAPLGRPALVQVFHAFAIALEAANLLLEHARLLPEADILLFGIDEQGPAVFQLPAHKITIGLQKKFLN